MNNFSNYFELIQIRNHAYNILSGMQFNIKVHEADKKKLSKLITEIDKKFIYSLSDILSILESSGSPPTSQDSNNISLLPVVGPANKLDSSLVITSEDLSQDKQLKLFELDDDVDSPKPEVIQEKKSPRFKRK